MKKRRTIAKAILLCLFLTVFALNASAQKVTLSFQNDTFEKVLNAIKKQTGLSLVFSEQLVDLNRKVSINVKSVDVEDALKQLLVGTNNSYEIKNKKLYFVERKDLEPKDNPTTQKKVSGTVTDQNGAPIIGASIVINGTMKGTISDVNGKFYLETLSDSKLKISYIGYLTEVVAVNNQNDLKISLNEDSKALDEVVVVGYGTQKKINLTGSVSTVSASDLIKRSNNDVGVLLEGTVPGMQVQQSSGEPGNESPAITIRGMGTFSSAGSNPLVLIDGIAGNLTSLNPADIESISVLKDAASASIYGSQAANGVILVTTKKGQAGVLNIEYSNNFQIQQPTRLPDLITNSAEYMNDWNYANERNNQPDYFSQGVINAYKNSPNSIQYPDFNWIKHMIKNGAEQNHYLSLSGGNEKTKFNVSFGYMDQNGIVIENALTYTKATMMANLSTKLNKIVTFGTEVSMNYSKRIEPVMGSTEFMLLCYSAGPEYMPYLSDGSGRWTWRYNNAAWNNRNPEQALSYGNIEHDIYSLAAQSYVDFNLTKGLVFEVKGAVNYDNEFDKSQEHAVASYFYSDNSLAALVTGYNPGVNNNINLNILATLYSTLNYQKKFGDHHLKALLGYSQEANNYRNLEAYRQTFPVTYLTELNAGSTTNQSLGGTSNAWSIQSYFGRLNYDYKEKYLLEGDFRNDGSSRLSPNNRWGFFPSLSAGYRLNEENFMKQFTWIDNLKLRASWGELGNQNIGLYPYQELMNVNSYPYDASGASQGASVSALTDSNLRWETTTVTDFGIDLSIKNGLLSLTGDVFKKLTNNILYQNPIPASVGLSAPTINYGSMENTGFEFEIGHANKIGDFKYSVNLNLSAVSNKVLQVTAPSIGGNTIIQDGLPWNSYYLYKVIGIFQSQDEINNSPTQPYPPKPGDLKYADVNGDGVINAKDRVVVGGAFPQFYYGSNMNFSWKNFDLSLFWQGVQGQKYYVNGQGFDPFTQGSAPMVSFAENAWTPANKSNTTPAMYTSGYGPVDGLASTYFLEDASYLRLKNILIGYNFSAEICKKIGMKSLRIYLSGDNLITFTKYPGADPERPGSGSFNTYPQLIDYTIGLNVNF